MKYKKIFFLISLILVFNFYFILGTEQFNPAGCVSADGKPVYNVDCVNHLLQYNPNILSFDTIQKTVGFNNLDSGMLTRNFQKYANTFGDFKVGLENNKLFSGLRFSNDGVISGDNFGSIKLESFPEKTEFTFSETSKPKIKFPDKSEMDTTKIGTNSKFDIEQGEFNLKDPRSATAKFLVKNDGDLVYENGKFYLNKEGVVSFPEKGVGITNSNLDRIEISPFGRSANANSISFYDGKLIASSSANGKYGIDFSDGRQVLNARGGILEFGKVEFGTRNLQSGMKGDDVKQLQRLVGEKEDGTFGSKTKQGLIDLQKNYNKQFPNEKIVEDGIFGPKTKSAFQKWFGDYGQITSYGKNFKLINLGAGDYAQKIVDANGKDVSLILGDKKSLINFADKSYFNSNSGSLINEVSSSTKSVPLSNPWKILETRYEDYRGIMEKATQDFTPKGLTSKKFNSILASIATRESSMGHNYGSVEVNDALLMGYDDPSSGGGNRFAGAEKQINGAAIALEKAFNNENSLYSQCSSLLDITEKSRCILSIYNTGQVNERGLKYADNILSYSKKWEQILS